MLDSRVNSESNMFSLCFHSSGVVQPHTYLQSEIIVIKYVQTTWGWGYKHCMIFSMGTSTYILDYVRWFVQKCLVIVYFKFFGSCMKSKDMQMYKAAKKINNW